MGNTSSNYETIPGSDVENGQRNSGNGPAVASSRGVPPTAPPMPAVGAGYSQYPGKPAGPSQLTSYPAYGQYANQPGGLWPQDHEPTYAVPQSAHFGPQGWPGGQHSYQQPGVPLPSAPIAPEYPVLHPFNQPQDPYMTAERKLRQGFVQKVLGMVSVQLLITVLIGSWVVTSRSLQHQLLSSLPMLLGIYLAPFVILLVLFCSDAARYTYPCNLLLLLAFTIAESFAVGLASLQYDTHIVLMAMAITGGLTLTLTLYALTTKSDLTVMGSTLYGLLVVLLVVSVANIFLHMRLLEVAISGGGALLFSVYIVYDVQLLAGGDHRYALSMEDYVPAALTIYLDILNLFLYLLQILQLISNSDSSS